MEHRVVAAAEGRFSGWPANNGIFQFAGDEVVVGFTESRHVVKAKGHNVVAPTEDDPQPFKSLLARSLDGGDKWQVEKPGGSFVGEASGRNAALLPSSVDFANDPGFAIRMEGTGYHGSTNPEGAFFMTQDGGASWSGPFALGALLQHPELQGMEITARTCYHVEASSGCLAALLSARPRSGWGRDAVATDKTFLVRSKDLVEWSFEGWLVPLSDPYRAVMPSLAVIAEGHWAVALRRRDIRNPGVDCWIDVVVTKDSGRTWSDPSRVGSTGRMNGNPPAMVATRDDGILCCVYGERNTRRILAQYCSDHQEGPAAMSWSDPVVLRDDFATAEGMADLGYPRLVQRESDGKLVAVYYWADAANPQQHIAATIFDPKAP